LKGNRQKTGLGTSPKAGPKGAHQIPLRVLAKTNEKVLLMVKAGKEINGWGRLKQTSANYEKAPESGGSYRRFVRQERKGAEKKKPNSPVNQRKRDQINPEDYPLKNSRRAKGTGNQAHSKKK